ncbi:MAG: PilZ domain-containing protein [Planctomycetota bacterium]
MSHARPNPLLLTWHRAVDELIDHNGSLEIVSIPEGDASLPPLRQRVRPFGLTVHDTTDTLVLERPRPTREHPVPTPSRSRVDVYLHTEMLRLVAAYEVVEAFNHQLNERQRLTALRLTRVGDVASAQRRASFRVDTSAAGFDRVAIHGFDRVGADTPDASPVLGHLLNLSAGGVGVRVDLPVSRLEAMLGHAFDFLITPPQRDAPLTVPARVRRIVKETASRTYLGLQFEFEDTAAHRSIAETLARLAADLQREQLRRRRSA